MGFLASLLPGVGDLRSPLVAGALWLSVYILLVPETVRSIVDGFKQYPEVVELVGSPGPVVISLAVALSYFLGLVAQTVVSPLVEGVGTMLLHFSRFIDSKRHVVMPPAGRFQRAKDRRPRWIFNLHRSRELHVWPFTIAGRSILIDAMQRSLGANGVRGIALMFFRVRTLEETLPFGAIQLSQTAPVQYQEHDRLKSETELRIAVVPPLVVISIVLSVRFSWLLTILGAIAVGALLVQAFKNTRQRYDLLANAAYLNLIDLPVVDATISGLSDLEPRPSTDGHWIAALIAAFDRRGLYDESDFALGEAQTLDSPQDLLDVIDYLRKYDIDVPASLHAAVERAREDEHRDVTRELIDSVLAEPGSSPPPPIRNSRTEPGSSENEGSTNDE